MTSNNSIQDTKKRLQQLLATSERTRTDAEWDEIIELEIQLAPGNRIDGSSGSIGGGGGGRQQPRNKQGDGNSQQRPRRQGGQGGQGGQGNYGNQGNQGNPGNQAVDPNNPGQPRAKRPPGAGNKQRRKPTTPKPAGQAPVVKKPVSE